MKPVKIACFLLAFSVSGGLWLWARSHERSGNAGKHQEIIISGGEKHRVTPEMTVEGREMLNRPAPDFNRNATDGRAHALKELVRRGPVVIAFIKKGCPCSEAAQPFLNNLKSAYPEASILGVIDVGEAEAKLWAEKFHVPFPLIADPGLDLMRSYRTRNSAYVVLVGNDSRIAGYWPGFSKEMFARLGEQLAKLSGLPVRPFDVADAPDDLYSGCPFDL